MSLSLAVEPVASWRHTRGIAYVCAIGLLCSFMTQNNPRDFPLVFRGVVDLLFMTVCFVGPFWVRWGVEGLGKRFAWYLAVVVVVSATGDGWMIAKVAFGGLGLWLEAHWFIASAATTHGSARYASENEVARELRSGVLLGTTMVATTRGGEVGRVPVRTEQHILAVAPTGAGKGRHHLIPNLLWMTEESFVVLDVKGELHAVTSRWRRSQGHECWVWDPYRVTSGDCCTFDLLRAIDATSPDAVADASELAHALVVEVAGQTGDAHWIEAARQLLVGLLLYAAETRQTDIGIVREWVSLSLFEVLEQMTASTLPAVRRAAGAQLSRPDREGASVVSTLARHLTWLDDPRLAAAVGPGARLNGGDLRDRPVSLFLCVPPDRIASATRAVRAITWLLLRDLTRQQRGRKVVIALDELAQLGRMEALEKAIAIARGYRIQLWMLVQSMTQLEAAYGAGNAGTLITNSLLVAWAAQDLKTSQMLSQALGQQTVETTSTQYGKDGGSTSHSSTARSLLTADEVRALHPRQAIVLARSMRPVLAFLPDYLEPVWAGRADSNPMHAHP